MIKEDKYKTYLEQNLTLMSPLSNWISNCANFCALIKQEFNHHWVGFYFVDNIKKELYLGPFQGPLACTVIPFGKGVCGKAWETLETQVVTDVHQFEGHIACSSQTNSEIVIPLILNNEFIGVLDIDSINFSEFNERDRFYLEQACQDLLKTKN